MAVRPPHKPEPDAGEKPITLRFPRDLVLDDAWLLELSSLNQNVRLERSAEGDLIVMPPTGTETGDRDSEVNMQLRIWAKKDGTGKAFGSSTGFRLPNGAVRSPDASWVSLERLATVSEEAYKTFAPLCPEFVLELASPTDSVSVLQKKMLEYAKNGALLGWLIVPGEKRVYVYTADGVEVLENPDTVSGDPTLAGFVLDLREVW